MSCSSFADSTLLVEMLRVIFQENFYHDNELSLLMTCLEDLPIIPCYSVDLEPDILALFKKYPKLKK